VAVTAGERIMAKATGRTAERVLGWCAFLAMCASVILSIGVAPPDAEQGNVQRLMYVHVPSAWLAYLSFFVVFVASIAYLTTRKIRWDRLAAASAEVGVLFTALTIVLGMLWGKPVWGAWWTWDPRITTTTVLLLIFVGYLALRAFVDDPDRRAQWSAAVGLLGALNVPIVYMSVRWWRTLHQVQSSPSTVDPRYALGLRANAVAVLILLVYFIHKRYRAAQLERAAEHLAEREALGHGAGHA
jgi:heme exporter protein C